MWPYTTETNTVGNQQQQTLRVIRGHDRTRTRSLMNLDGRAPHYTDLTTQRHTNTDAAVPGTAVTVPGRISAGRS